jgi:hypothetical protein
MVLPLQVDFIVLSGFDITIGFHCVIWFCHCKWISLCHLVLPLQVDFIVLCGFAITSGFQCTFDSNWWQTGVAAVIITLILVLVIACCGQCVEALCLWANINTLGHSTCQVITYNLQSTLPHY